MATNSPFKIGDEVRITGTTLNNGGVGSTGVVTSQECWWEQTKSWYHNVDTDPLGAGWAVAVENLELLEPPVTEAEVQAAIRSITGGAYD